MMKTQALLMKFIDENDLLRSVKNDKPEVINWHINRIAKSIPFEQYVRRKRIIEQAKSDKVVSLNLVIEDGMHIFYTEKGERIDYCAGTSIVQNNVELWTSGASRLVATLFLFPYITGSNNGVRELKPCAYDESTGLIKTPKGYYLLTNAVEPTKEMNEDYVSSARITGICNLKKQ